MPAPETKSYKCRHIRISGRRCGDPALRDENFCFFHANNRRPPKHLGVDPDFAVFAFPPLEDHASILHALTDTLARVAAEYGVPDPNTSTSILDRVVEELRLQRLAGFIDRYPNGEPIAPEDRLIPANWPRHHPIHNPQPNPTPEEIVILSEREGPASPTPEQTLTLTACEEPAPQKARVPHSSQLHRDGWDVIRPPATPSPYPTTQVPLRKIAQKPATVARPPALHLPPGT